MKVVPSGRFTLSSFLAAIFTVGCSTQAQLKVDAPVSVSAPVDIAIEKTEPPSKVGDAAISTEHDKSPAQSAREALKKPPITSLFGLLWTLLEGKEERADRIGPAVPPSSKPIPEPPRLLEYSLSEEQKKQLDPLMGLLVQDFELAKLNDAEYQSSLLEFRTSMLEANVAGLAYLPSFNLSNRFVDNEPSARTTISITQPLFNLDRIATLKEEDSRRALAQAQMKIREFELVERVFNTVTNLMLASERLRVNSARIEALESSAMGAKRELELGRGTITDLRDSEVRLEQAKAEQLQFEASKNTAMRTLEQLTGRKPSPELYVLRKAPRVLDIPAVNAIREQALQYNNGLIQSRARQRLAELGALRARSQYIPSLNFSAVRSYSAIGDNQNSGVTFGFDVPVNAGAVSQAEVAAARISQAQLTTRKVQEDIERDIELRHTEVALGVQEANLRLRAIDAAELSQLATEKSFKGGVRTRIDVLNSVQTTYVINEQYINSVINLARNYLVLSNRSANPVGETVNTLQHILF